MARSRKACMKNLYMALALTALMVVAASFLTATVNAEEVKVSLGYLERIGKPVVYPLPVKGAVFAEIYEDKLILVYREGSTYVAAVRSINDLTRNLYTYPLSGTPVLIKFNPYTRLIAIATDSGELAAGKIEGGKIKFYRLHGGHGAARGLAVVGSTIVVLWSTRLGAELQLLTLGENGWYEIAPLTGNLTKLRMPGYTVIDFRELGEGQWPSRTDHYIVLEYTLAPQLQVLVSITYYNATLDKTIAVSNSLVEIYVPSLRYAYTTTTDSNGHAILLLPATAPVGAVEKINATLIVRFAGSTYVKKVVLAVPVEPRRLVALNTTIVLTEYDRSPIPPTPVVAYRISIAEVSGLSLNIKRTLEITALTQPKILSFNTLETPAGRRYVLLLEAVFQSYGRSLLIYILDEDFNIVKLAYMPLKADITSYAVTSDGRTIVLGFDDGTVEVLFYDDNRAGYYEAWSYKASPTSRPIALISVNAGLGSLDNVESILTLSENGELQLLATNTTILAPLLRVNETLVFNIGGSPLWLTSSNKANLIILSQPARLYFIVGLGSAASSKSLIDPLDLDKYIVTRLLIRVLGEGGEQVANATIEIYLGDKLITTAHSGRDGVAIVEPILPGSYRVVVKPPKGVDWLKENETRVFVPPAGGNTTIILPYRPLTVEVKLTDNVSGGPPLEPLELYVDGKLVARTKPGQEVVKLKLVKGHYTITIKPVETDTLYKPVNTTIDVPGNTSVLVKLQRVYRTITLVILGEDGSRIKEPVEVDVSQAGVTFYKGVVRSNDIPLVLRIPAKGEAEVTIVPIPPPGETPMYQPVTATLKLVNGAIKVIRLPFTHIILTLSLIDADTGEPPATPLRIVVDGRTVVNATAGTRLLTLSLVKGRHIIVVDSLPSKTIPVPLYKPVRIVVDLRKPEVVAVELRRAYTLLHVRLVDRIAHTAPQDSIEVIYNSTIIGMSKPGQRVLDIYVPRGTVQLELRSKNKLYYPLKLKINVTGIEANTTAYLRRRVVSFTVQVVDIAGRKLTGVTVVAVGQDIPYATSSLTVDGQAVLQIPYGTYLVCAQHSWFYKRCQPVDPLAVNKLVLVLSYTPTGLVMANLALITSVIAVVILAAVLIGLRKRILKALAPEEEVF